MIASVSCSRALGGACPPVNVGQVSPGCTWPKKATMAEVWATSDTGSQPKNEPGVALEPASPTSSTTAGDIASATVHPGSGNGDIIRCLQRDEKLDARSPPPLHTLLHSEPGYSRFCPSVQSILMKNLLKIDGVTCVTRLLGAHASSSVQESRRKILRTSPFVFARVECTEK
jgi:hypothetical protein